MSGWDANAMMMMEGIFNWGSILRPRSAGGLCTSCTSWHNDYRLAK